MHHLLLHGHVNELVLGLVANQARLLLHHHRLE
jgi:hypothetical protein